MLLLSLLELLLLPESGLMPLLLSLVFSRAHLNQLSENTSILLRVAHINLVLVHHVYSFDIGRE